MDTPRPDLRCKQTVDASLSDRQLFNQMVNNDLWLDAGLPEVLAYCWGNKHLEVPDSWYECMTAYVEQVYQKVLWYNYIYVLSCIHVDFSSLFRCPWPRKSKVTPSTWWLDPMRTMAIHAIRNWSIIRPETFLKLDAGTGEQNVNKGSSVFCFFATMCGLRGRNSSAKTRKTNANTCKRAQI